MQQFGRTPPGHAPPPPAHRRAGGSVSNAMFTDIDGQHWTGTYDGTTFTAVESNSLDPTKSDVMPWVLQTTPGHVYKMGPGSDGKWSNLGDQGAYEPADSGGGGGGGGAPQQDPSVDPSTGQPYAQPSTGMPYGAPQYPTSAPQYPTSAPQYPTAAPQYAQQADLGMDPSGDQMMDTSSDGSTDGMIGSGDVNDMLDFGGG